MSSQRLDPNLIRQLEEAYYGQTGLEQPPAIDLAAMQAAPAPAPMPAAAPPVRQMPTQVDLNIQNQEGNAPEAPMSLTDQLAQAYAQQQGLQSEAIKSAEEQLSAARSQPQQMDLSPLIALAESWSGKPSRLLQTYQRPQDQAKTVQALQEAVLKARGGASELARMRAKDVAQLEEQQQARQQRLQEIALKRKELGLMSESKSAEKEEAKVLGVRKDYNKNFAGAITGLSQVMNAAERIKALIKETGGIPSSPSDPRRQEYISAVSDLTTGFNRDVAKLGALAGADLELLNAATSNSTSLVDAYFKNLMGRGSIQGTVNVLDGILQRGDSSMGEFQQRVKDTYLGYADEPFKNQKSFYKKSREQGRLRKGLSFDTMDEESSEMPSGDFTEEQVKQMSDEEVQKIYNARQGKAK